MNLTLKERLIQILEENIEGLTKSKAIKYITSAHPEKGFVYNLDDKYQTDLIFEEHWREILELILEHHTNCNPYLTAQEMVWYCWDVMILGNIDLIEKLYEDYDENEKY